MERHVFISYSRADAVWLDRLKVHLRPLTRQGGLEIWDDSRVAPGQDWRRAVERALLRAHVAVLLISADFLASDFIVNNELAPIVHRASRDGLLVLPLVVSPCLFGEHDELSRYQCVNNPERPLAALPQPEAEAVLLSLARNVSDYFRLLESKPSPPSNVTTARSTEGDAAYLRPTERASKSGARSTLEAARHRNPLIVDRPMNLSFDGSSADGVPVGWFNSFGYVSGVSTDYRIDVVRRSQRPIDGACLLLESSAAKERDFGSVMQRCPGQFLAGRTIRLEGELRGENVALWGGLWLRADAEEQPNLFFDNMYRRPVIGTTGWNRYFIDAPIPPSTDWLNYGVVLSGAGSLYADNLRILVWNPEGRWDEV